MKPIYQKLVEQHGLSNAHQLILQAVPGSYSQILEIGSSSGYLTKELKTTGHDVDIVEVDKAAFTSAKHYARQAFAGSIEELSIQKKIKDDYDIIICADVLEHLVNPDKVLLFLKQKLKKTGFMLISIPNIAFWDMRQQLLFRGDFSYQESGLLDKTHLRFYSYNNFLYLLKKLNFRVLAIWPAEARIPLEYTMKKIPLLGQLFLQLFKKQLVLQNPNLTFFQYVVKITN